MVLFGFTSTLELPALPIACLRLSVNVPLMFRSVGALFMLYLSLCVRGMMGWGVPLMVDSPLQPGYMANPGDQETGSETSETALQEKKYYYQRAETRKKQKSC